jgi:trans-aconitate methyltransferase
MKLSRDQLIPPDDLLAAYAVNAEQFADHGSGFVREVLVKRGNLQPHERVLDLGCGPGPGH